MGLDSCFGVYTVIIYSTYDDKQTQGQGALELIVLSGGLSQEQAVKASKQTGQVN